MIDKQEFYHGAALVRLLSHPLCRSVKKAGGGYIVNENVYLLIKYTTKHRSPWRFTFSQEDIRLVMTNLASPRRVVIVFVNGGDGISALTGLELSHILGDIPGWASMSRRFNKQYAVAGSKNLLQKKCSLSRWPDLVFDDGDQCLI
jgi:hypothetical protein